MCGDPGCAVPVTVAAVDSDARKRGDEGLWSGSRRSIGNWGIAAVCAILLMGCSSTVAGVAVEGLEPSDASGVNVALMDTGQYPTHAGHPLGTAGNAQKGAYLDAVRMAEFVVGPWEVDAALQNVAIFNTGPIASADGLKNDLGDEPSAVAAAHGFIDGFSTSRSASAPGPQRSLINLVMRFPEAAAASVAAGEMADKALGTADPPRRPASIPGHPEALASTYDEVDGGKTTQSFVAHGTYVLFQWATVKADVDVATSLVAKTIELQVGRIDGFTPTGQAKLADLPVDPTGQLLARVMPPPQGKTALPYAGAYPPRGALHFDDDPSESASVFASSGVEMVGYRWGPMVYQAHDEQGAARVAERFIADARDVKPVTAVRGLPVAKCFAGKDIIANKAIFECFARADRYAFDAVALQETDAKQMTAAQYRILAGK